MHLHLHLQSENVEISTASRAYIHNASLAHNQITSTTTPLLQPLTSSPPQLRLPSSLTDTPATLERTTTYLHTSPHSHTHQPLSHSPTTHTQALRDFSRNLARKHTITARLTTRPEDVPFPAPSDGTNGANKVHSLGKLLNNIIVVVVDMYTSHVGVCVHKLGRIIECLC